MKGSIVKVSGKHRICPLLTASEELEKELLNRFPNDVVADIMVLSKSDLLGKPLADQYVITKLYDKVSSGNPVARGGKSSTAPTEVSPTAPKEKTEDEKK